MRDSIFSRKRQAIIDHIVVRYEFHITRLKKIVEKIGKKHSKKIAEPKEEQLEKMVPQL